MEYISQEAPENPVVHKIPTKNAVLLFCSAIAVSFLLVIAGVGYSLWHGQHALSSNNQQWCTALTDLTSSPIAKPADPKANPSREFSYELYTDFKGLKTKFGCAN